LKNFAVLLLLSCGQFGKAIEILSGFIEHRYLSLLFLQYCRDNSLVKIKENQEAIPKHVSNVISRSLCEKIYADNAKVFYKLDNMEVFKDLCGQAGEMGETLLSN
jgi:hypothetical protein